jgi:putative DNA methylase
MSENTQTEPALFGEAGAFACLSARMPEYRRRLPHFQPEETFRFVTWRLWGSLAAAKPAILYPSPGHAFVAHDRELDRMAEGPQWLAIPSIADLVSRAILYGETRRSFYCLSAWVVMPNHVHLLIRPLVPFPVLMRWLEGSTARNANGILGRTGQPFWRDESYDHYLRDSSQLTRTANYIEKNPVSAGLVNSADKWLWSSAGWQAEAPASPYDYS